MDKKTQKAKRIIAENIYMSIATASKDGVPWISPVFFAYDKKYNLYWVSNKDARHSNLLRQNPKAAIVIFDSTATEGKGDAVYFEATTKELEDGNEIKSAIDILNNRVSKDEFMAKGITEVTGNAAWRIYKATPSKVWTLAEGKINDQYVDLKVEVKLF